MRCLRTIGLLGVLATMVAVFAVPADSAVVAAQRGSAPRFNRSATTVIDPEQGRISGLSCPTEHFCAAADSSDVAMWRSGHLARLTSAGRPWSVACGTPDYCVAGVVHHVAVWDGSKWTTYRDADAPQAKLFDTSCAPGTTMCVATGSHFYAVFDGGSVQFFSMPGRLALGPLSCATPTFCMSIYNKSSYRFDGTSWTSAGELPKDDPSYGGEYISCPTTSFCLAGGGHGFSVYDGTSWHGAPRIPLDDTTGMGCSAANDCVIADGDDSVTFSSSGPSDVERISKAVDVTAVSCVPGSSCVAVDRHGHQFRHTGSGWSGPERFSAVSGFLTDVSCVRISWCVAVDGNGNAVQGAGSSWRTPEAIDHFRPLTAVSCAKGRVCAAVDQKGYAAVYKSGRWGHPHLIDKAKYLRDVSCATTTRCVAADDEGRVFTWNGSHWSAPKRIATGYDSLRSIDCPSPHRCFAIGYQRHSGLHVLRGGKWTTVGIPHGGFNEISCLQARFCAVVMDHGFEYRVNGSWSRLVKTAWRPATGVGCINEHACLGIGHYRPLGSRTLALAMNGAAVRRIQMKTAPTVLSCVAHAGCVAVTNDSAETITLK